MGHGARGLLAPTAIAWDYFPHDHARSRAYRWGEDGLLGITRPPVPPVLRPGAVERRGSDPQGAAVRADRPRGQPRRGRQGALLLPRLHAHPLLHEGPLQVPAGARFPTSSCVEENAPTAAARTPSSSSLDTGVFDEDRYFDVTVEYAKASPDDILIRITVANRGPEAAPLHVLPTLWFRNTWSWGCERGGVLAEAPDRPTDERRVVADHAEPGTVPASRGRWPPTGSRRRCSSPRTRPTPSGCSGRRTRRPYDEGRLPRLRRRRTARTRSIPAGTGTKAAALYRLELPPGETVALRLRLTSAEASAPDALRRRLRRVVRDAGRRGRRLLRGRAARRAWTTRSGACRARPTPACSGPSSSTTTTSATGSRATRPSRRPRAQRREGRNHDWRHLYNRDVISMPDKWEYPWYAAWDLAFH